ncbi:uncharacterized protein [Periplaneta americana]|uniref:uncharacterized protein n=1 Tax=Periplaneta americana TaxID=6978 RepID=UPI0037E70E4E
MCPVHQTLSNKHYFLLVNDKMTAQKVILMLAVVICALLSGVIADAQANTTTAATKSENTTTPSTTATTASTTTAESSTTQGSSTIPGTNSTPEKKPGIFEKMGQLMNAMNPKNFAHNIIETIKNFFKKNDKKDVYLAKEPVTMMSGNFSTTTKVTPVVIGHFRLAKKLFGLE